MKKQRFPVLRYRRQPEHTINYAYDHFNSSLAKDRCSAIDTLAQKSKFLALKVIEPKDHQVLCPISATFGK